MGGGEIKGGGYRFSPLFLFLSLLVHGVNEIYFQNMENNPHFNFSILLSVLK